MSLKVTLLQQQLQKLTQEHITLMAKVQQLTIENVGFRGTVDTVVDKYENDKIIILNLEDRLHKMIDQLSHSDEMISEYVKAALKAYIVKLGAAL